MKLSKITLACILATGFAAPQIASADDALEFHGYARWGTSYEKDGNTTVSADGQTGAAAGRIGNQGNGGGWDLVKKIEAENGTQWDMGFTVEDWGDLEVKQAYAGASNVFVAQPNAYIWAGMAFHSRMQQDLNDYYVSQNDGQGAGIKNIELGFANLELGFVGDTDSVGEYAVTSKLSDIKLGDELKLDIIANYGFSDNYVDEDDDDSASGTEAYLVAAHFSGWGQNFYYRHADNVENNLLTGKEEDKSSDYFSIDGSYSLSDKAGIEYSTSYHDIKQITDDDDDSTGDRVNYNVIVRPTYAWNDIHSTWIDIGYSVVDFDDASKDDNIAYKVTLSQNIAVGGSTWSRPQLRFYVTAGHEENAGVTSNPVIVGTMFEAWW